MTPREERAMQQWAYYGIVNRHMKKLLVQMGEELEKKEPQMCSHGMYEIHWQTRTVSGHTPSSFKDYDEVLKITDYANSKVAHFFAAKQPTPIFWWVVAVRRNQMPRRKFNRCITTMTGEVGRLREGEKFYKGGKKMPYTVVDPFHRMGVKCHHPRMTGYSYFEPDRLFAVDLRFAPLWFPNRTLASPANNPNKPDQKSSVLSD